VNAVPPRATGMPIRAIRRYAQLVSAGHGNEEERLALMEAHRAEVTAKLSDPFRTGPWVPWLHAHSS